MVITLNDEEIREALRQAALDKVSNVVQMEDESNCYFTIEKNGEEIDDIESIEFSIVI